MGWLGLRTQLNDFRKSDKRQTLGSVVLSSPGSELQRISESSNAESSSTAKQTVTKVEVKQPKVEPKLKQPKIEKKQVDSKKAETVAPGSSGRAPKMKWD